MKDLGAWGHKRQGAARFSARVAILLCAAAFSFASLPAKAANEAFDPWKLQWVDPWATSSQAEVTESRVSRSTIPTLGDAGFWPLLRAMSMYEQIQEWGGWKPIPNGEKIEKGMREDYTVLVGGAPLNEEFGKAIGADAYCRDSAVAVETAKEFMARKHNRMAANA